MDILLDIAGLVASYPRASIITFLVLLIVAGLVVLFFVAIVP